MILGSNEEQDQTTCHIQKCQLRLFLLLELSPLLVFEFDFLSLLYNTNTLRNILMMLGTGRDDVLRTRMTTQAGLGWGVGGGGGGVVRGHIFLSKKLF